MRLRALRHLRGRLDPRGLVARRGRPQQETDGFRLHFQPVIDLRAGGIVALESLVRLDDPERGLLKARDFVYGLSAREDREFLAKWAIERSVTTIAQWQQDGLSPPLTTVNVSLADVHELDLVGVLEDALEAHRVSPGCIQLEFPTGAFALPSQVLMELLGALRTLGVQLAIDLADHDRDALQRAAALEVSAAKIDLHSAASSEAGHDRAEAAMSVAKSFGLVTTAKRVETLAQLDVVRSLGCDRAQGYAFGEPWSASETAAILKQVSSGAGAATAGGEGMSLAARAEEREPLLLAADRAALVSEGQEPQILHAILLDISETGMQLRLAEPAKIGDEIWLEFALDGPTALKARVTVVDITPMGQTFRVGASYTPDHGSEQSIAARLRELAAGRPPAALEEPAARTRRSSIPTDPLGDPREWRAALLAQIAEHPDWDEERVYEAGLDAGLWERDGDYAAHRDRNRKRVVRLRRSASKLAATAPDVRAKAS